MIYKRCSRCGKRIPSGTTCECLKRRHAEYDRLSRDKKSKSFYDSAEWRRVRQEILSRDAIDQWLFRTKGLVVAADTVHHIIPLREAWDRRCDPLNLIALSDATHSEIEAVYKTAGKADLQRELLEIVRQKG